MLSGYGNVNIDIVPAAMLINGDGDYNVNNRSKGD